jgi:hypothetical protein
MPQTQRSVSAPIAKSPWRVAEEGSEQIALYERNAQADGSEKTRSAMSAMLSANLSALGGVASVAQLPRADAHPDSLRRSGKPLSVPPGAGSKISERSSNISGLFRRERRRRPENADSGKGPDLAKIAGQSEHRRLPQTYDCLRRATHEMNK